MKKLTLSLLAAVIFFPSSFAFSRGVWGEGGLEKSFFLYCERPVRTIDHYRGYDHGCVNHFNYAKELYGSEKKEKYRLALLTFQRCAGEERYIEALAKLPALDTGITERLALFCARAIRKLGKKER